MDTLIFYIAVAALILHELDAIQQEEWRFFLTWTGLSDVNAYRVFAAAHLPLFVLILWLLPDPRFRIGMDLFLIVHAGLHTALRNHRYVRFNSAFSRLWIYGAALAAVVHLLMMQG